MVHPALILLQAQSGGSILGGILPILLMVGIFYFLVFMPMQRQKKQQQQMLSNLQNGQTVLTTGGMVGTIVTINSDDTLILRVKPDNIKIQVARTAVAGLVGTEENTKKS